MTTFTELARNLDTSFDNLVFFDKLQLVGAYLLEEYKHPNEMEPLIESMSPALNKPSEHALRFYNMMANGVMGEANGADWSFDLAQLIVRTYSGLVQTAIDKANKPPPWVDDEPTRNQRFTRVCR